jgi:ABC-type branched-subunit amino acid transport system ATPase component
MIQLEGVTKRYGRLLAVDGLSFTVRRGKCCVLRGVQWDCRGTSSETTTTLRSHDQPRAPERGVLHGVAHLEMFLAQAARGA